MVDEKHCRQLFASLNRVEGILSKQRYLVGDQWTEADVRLFTTMLRFDPVYVGHFKCNLSTIEHGFPHVLGWMRRFYQLPGVKPTCNMKHIKDHYYVSHVKINPTRIVPLSNGPDLDVSDDSVAK
jgi:putative glutathione S-transferase